MEKGSSSPSRCVGLLKKLRTYIRRARIRASQEAGLTTIPAYIIKVYRRGDAGVALVENLQRDI